MSAIDYLLDRYGYTMTPADVAEVLHCHPSHARAMCASGELPAVQIGKRWHVLTGKLAAILDAADD